VISKQNAHHYATNMVREMLTAAHSDGSSPDEARPATRALMALLNNKVTKRLLAEIETVPPKETRWKERP
jgi:hypothetical protein